MTRGYWGEIDLHATVLTGGRVNDTVAKRDSLLVRASDSRSRGCEFEFRHAGEAGRTGVLTLIRCPFHPRVTAVARERPRSFCQKCRWQVHLNTHRPLTQRSRSGLTMPLFRHSKGTYQETTSHATRQGNTRPQSSQFAEPLWTDPGLRSGISMRDLISTSKKN